MIIDIIPMECMDMASTVSNNDMNKKCQDYVYENESTKVLYKK